MGNLLASQAGMTTPDQVFVVLSSLSPEDFPLRTPPNPPVCRTKQPLSRSAIEMFSSQSKLRGFYHLPSVINLDFFGIQPGTRYKIQISNLPGQLHIHKHVRFR